MLPSLTEAEALHSFYLSYGKDERTSVIGDGNDKII